MLDKLPEELLLSIFGFLSYGDIKSLRQTCKNCYYASLAHHIIKNEIINLDCRMRKPENVSVIESLKATDRIIYHVSVIDFNQHDYFWIFSKFGSWLKTVSFTNCTVEFLQFAYVLQKLENLEELRISNCANLLIDGTTLIPELETPKLINVKALEISNTKYLTDEALYRFCKICPNIEHLSIEATTLNCHGGVYQFNYKYNTNILDKPSPNVLTIQFVTALIHSKRNKITSLNFSSTIINNSALKGILEIDGLKLSRLNLNNCRELRQTMLDGLGYWHQPNLIELQLANCDLVSNDFLVHISLTMPNLNILNISDNRNITEVGFKHIRTLENIIELDISNCNNIDSVVMVEVLTTKNIAATLKILKINKTSICEDDFICLMYSLQLSELEISDCFKLMIHTRILRSIFVLQKSLKKLETDSHFTEVTEFSNIRLPDIDLIKYKAMDISLLDVQEEIYSESIFHYTTITTCPYSSVDCLEDLATLERLNLSKCPVIDLIFFLPTMGLQNLKSLSLSGIKSITSQSMLILPHFYPNLEILDLSDTFVDDIGICVVVRKLYRLKNLNLQNTKISNVSLLYIIQHCKQLNILNIHRCSDLCNKLLEQVRSLPTVIKVVGRPTNKIEVDSTTIPGPPRPPSNV